MAITNNTQLNDNSQSIIASNGYLMMIPQTLGDDSELTIAAKNGNETTFSLSGQKWNAGDKINYQIDIAGNPSDINNTVITNGFVGAFWEYDDTTERIIRMHKAGNREVSVLCAGHTW